MDAAQIAGNAKYELMQEHKKGRKLILNQKKKVNVEKKLLRTSTVVTDKDSRGKKYWTT